MQNEIANEVLHWMHQRGDTIGATRLLSSRRWVISFKDFEKPVVFVTKKFLFMIASVEGLDIDGTFYNPHLEHQIPQKCENVRVRIYWRANNVLNIMNDVQSFKTIGSMEDCSNLFKNSAINIPLLFDTKNVQSLQRTFMNVRSFNQPLHWDTKNCRDFSCAFAFANSFNQNLFWNLQRLEIEFWMATGSMQTSTMFAKIDVRCEISCVIPTFEAIVLKQ